MPETTVLVLGTCDTKLQELLFLKDQIQAHSSVRAILLDVGRENVQDERIDISRAKLMAKCSEDQDVSSLPRGEVIKFMASCAGRVVKELYQKSEIHGIVSAGGSGGTSLAAVVMRTELPIGFPKARFPIQAPIALSSRKIRLAVLVYIGLDGIPERYRQLVTWISGGSLGKVYLDERLLTGCCSR